MDVCIGSQIGSVCVPFWSVRRATAAAVSCVPMVELRVYPISVFYYDKNYLICTILVTRAILRAGAPVLTITYTVNKYSLKSTKEGP